MRKQCNSMQAQHDWSKLFSRWYIFILCFTWVNTSHYLLCTSLRPSKLLRKKTVITYHRPEQWRRCFCGERQCFWPHTCSCLCPPAELFWWQDYGQRWWKNWGRPLGQSHPHFSATPPEKCVLVFKIHSNRRWTVLIMWWTRCATVECDDVLQVPDTVVK